MKKFVLFGFAAGLMLFGCKKETIQATQDQLDPTFKNDGKVNICHVDEYGNHFVLNINANAVNGHVGHGDVYDMDGDGYYPENECGLMGDYDVFDCDDTDPLKNVSCCATSFVQDFSADASGWNFGGSYGNVVFNSGTAILTGTARGPYSYYDDPAPAVYRTAWPMGGWYSEIDVYLDPSWADLNGFDFSVSASRQDGTHLRDFIFHVGVVAGNGLLVNASNNADFTTNAFKLLNENGGNYFTVTSAGWYTLRHVFYDNSGALAADLQLLDINGNILWTATRTDPSDLISTVVGGSRYGWFTHINVAGGIEIDNQELYRGCSPN